MAYRDVPRGSACGPGYLIDGRRYQMKWLPHHLLYEIKRGAIGQSIPHHTDEIRRIPSSWNHLPGIALLVEITPYYFGAGAIPHQTRS